MRSEAVVVRPTIETGAWPADGDAECGAVPLSSAVAEGSCRPFVFRYNTPAHGGTVCLGKLIQPGHYPVRAGHSFEMRQHRL
jgi:hypothetical protein